jgi:hypothetical protein
MVVVFVLWSCSCLVRFLCSKLFISGTDYYTHREVLGLLRVYSIYGLCIGFMSLVVVYSEYYGTSRMQCYCICWRVRNLLMIVLSLNELAESIMSLHTRLLRPITDLVSQPPPPPPPPPLLQTGTYPSASAPLIDYISEL